MKDDRYDRQIPVFGIVGQERIMEGTVGIAGCGGLGVNVITQLTMAGVSRFVICDPQRPESTNLNRQFIYSLDSQGFKSEIAAEWIRSLNPYAEVKVSTERVSMVSGHLFSECDVLVDCLDNIEGRMALSDISEVHRIPLVHAGVQDTFGQIAVCIPGRTPTLREMIGTLPESNGIAPSVGAAVSVIAGMEALEVLKLLAGIESMAVGRIVTLDMSTWTTESFGFR